MSKILNFKALILSALFAVGLAFGGIGLPSDTIAKGAQEPSGEGTQLSLSADSKDRDIKVAEKKDKKKKATVKKKKKKTTTKKKTKSEPKKTERRGSYD